MSKQVNWNKKLVDKFIEEAMLSDDEQKILISRAKGWTRTKQANEYGMPVAGATATATGAIGDVVTLPIPTALVRVRCCGDSVLSVRISGQATTAYNLGWSVEKE